MKKAKKLLCALLIVLTAVTMLSGPFQVPVQAARTVTANKNPNKAVNIKKKGTYRVLSKTKMNKDDYIRFTAPKKGKYTLTFSDFRKLKGYTPSERHLGSVYIYKNTKYGRSMQRVKTNGGKSYTLSICSKAWYNTYTKGRKIKAASDLHPRYAKISLKKGETIYIKTFWTGGKHSYSLKIK